MRYCHTSTRKAKSKKQNNKTNKQVLPIPITRQDAEQQEPSQLAFWWEYQMYSILKDNLAAPYKALHVPLYDPAIMSLGIYSTAKIIPLLVPISVLLHTKNCTQTYITTLYIIALNWKQPRCPSMSESINFHIHTMDYYPVIK